VTEERVARGGIECRAVLAVVCMQHANVSGVRRR
jgi:hypothetical protein